jgi:hypothetical protein
MALSAAFTGNFTPGSGGQGSFEVKNTSVIYPGALCSFDGTSGRIKPYDGTIGDRLAGWSMGVPPVVGSAVITGNTSPASGYTAPRVALMFGGSGMTILACPVTGASAETDQGKPVYATDDGTYTLTDPTTHRVAVGFVRHYRSSGVADVVTSYIIGVLGA